MGTALALRGFLNAIFSDIQYRLIQTVVQGDLLRFADNGRIIEHWAVRDDAAMMRQIGMPPP